MRDRVHEHREIREVYVYSSRNICILYRLLPIFNKSLRLLSQVSLGNFRLGNQWFEAVFDGCLSDLLHFRDRNLIASP